MKINYINKISDPLWKAKRNRILARDGNKCVICGKSDGTLHVHHKQYHFIKRLQTAVDPWNYNDRYLITLCTDCHNLGHSLYDVPVKYI